MVNQSHTHKDECHSCGSNDVAKILDLGEMALANAFLKKSELDQPEIKVPLVLYFCRSCGLVQLLDEVDPAILFKDYDYLTSASTPLVKHFEEMAKYLVEQFITNKDDLMVEIGGNDGSLLGAVKDSCRALNVDPASNVAKLSEAKGVPTLNAFFGSVVAEEIVEKYGTAKVAVANNVMAHIPTIKDIFEGVRTLIGEDGVFVMEVHWVGNLIGDGGFDQIYHEHLFYYSLHALRTLVRQLGLETFDVETVPIHGESMRVFIAKNRTITERAQAFLKREEEMGLMDEATFVKFSNKVTKSKEVLSSLLHELKSQGKKIAGYGAPAKGNTLLNYFEIGPDVLDFITDTTPLKQGLYSPGMHIPVVAPERLLNEPPDYVLLLAWNYADAILKKEDALRQRGVKFIIPVPEVRVV
jgi:hypothetical protein